MLLQTRETTSGRMLSSKELHSYMEVGRVFASWIRGRVEKYSYEIDKDYREVWVDNETGEIVETISDASAMVNNGYQKDYFVTVNMAKELCMLENNEQGIKARNYLIENEQIYINSLLAKLHLLDGGKIDNKKLEEWKKLVEMMKELHPTLFKFKKQMLNMIWQANKLSDELNETKKIEIKE